MASSTEICNMALVHLGQDPIITLDDETKQSRLCKRLYTPVLEATLRSYPWTFAIRRVVLAPDIVKPAFGYEKQYTLPTDCLRIVSICIPEDCYTVEGNKVLTDHDEVKLRYVTRNVTPDAFDPQFDQAVALRLAKNLCQVLTADQDLMKILDQLETNSILRAQNTNAIETSPQPVFEGPWLTARY